MRVLVQHFPQLFARHMTKDLMHGVHGFRSSRTRLILFQPRSS